MSEMPTAVIPPAGTPDGMLTDFDLHLFGEGTHYRIFEKLGAHVIERDGVRGVYFAVWAPNAEQVNVIGAFNQWDKQRHPMRRHAGSGIWELFVPGLGAGVEYKYFLRGPRHFSADKADPYGFAAELRPNSASRVWDVHAYAWQDAAWMERRAQTNWLKRPISVYEVHLGSWRRPADRKNGFLTYRELADELIPYVLDLGYTHIELLPVTEHPFDGSWGYQTVGYFAPTARHGSPDDFKFFVDQCHQRGLGVIVDWVPAHFPKDGHGLAYFDGTHLYEHADPRQGEHRDWGTLVFNYGRNEVRCFLLANALFWAEVYHVDGLRVDAVASMLYLDYSRKPGEWIPNRYGGNENLDAVSFLKKFNELLHEQFPGILTFAEESTAWPMVSRPTYLGGLGFTLKWNMGWMHDTLEYFSKDPVHRKYHHNDITFSLLYAFTENFILPFSHDEVVHGKKSLLDKMPGDRWRKFAGLRLLYGYLFAHPGKKLLFMGGEFGQWNEWNSGGQLDWNLLDFDDHRGVRQLVRDLHRLYREHPALSAHDFTWDGFEWIEFHDSEQSIIAFLRKGDRPAERLLCVCNFTPVPRLDYRLGLPDPGVYREALNTDSALYGGSNVGNAGAIRTTPEPYAGRPCSVRLALPPLGALWFAYDETASAENAAPPAPPPAAAAESPAAPAAPGDAHARA